MPDQSAAAPGADDAEAGAAASSAPDPGLSALVLRAARTARPAVPTDPSTATVDAWMGCLGSAPGVRLDAGARAGRPAPDG
ncbi:MAG: hypothetical protein ACRCSN_18875 [Dermatophilaceae bacterium]